MLDRTRDGRRCAAGLALFQDEIIKLIYDFSASHIYRAQNPTAAERMAIVATTGGYGRGLLAPGSDIDLLFVLPYKQTAWGESVVEFILDFLWDLGFKVGHATRTIDQTMKAAKEDMTVRTTLLDARFLYGESTLFNEMRARFVTGVVQGTQREFIAAKLEEESSGSNGRACRVTELSRTSRRARAACGTSTCCTGSRSTLIQTSTGSPKEGSSRPTKRPFSTTAKPSLDHSLLSPLPCRKGRGAAHLRPATRHGQASALP